MGSQARAVVLHSELRFRLGKPIRKILVHHFATAGTLTCSLILCNTRQAQYKRDDRRALFATRTHPAGVDETFLAL